MEPTCLFCLDPIKDNPAQNPIGCSCKIFLHPECLQQWWNQKQQIECPVCHTIAILNRQPEPQENLQIVYLPMNEETPQRIRRSQEKCIGFCCLGLLLWSLSLVILNYVFEK